MHDNSDLQKSRESKACRKALILTGPLSVQHAVSATALQVSAVVSGQSGCPDRIDFDQITEGGPGSPSRREVA